MNIHRTALSPGADLVEELLPVLALGPLVRAGDLNHVGC